MTGDAVTAGSDRNQPSVKGSEVLSREDVIAGVRADIHHLVQPVIGFMRLKAHREEAPTADDLAGWVRRLFVVLEVVDVLGDRDARAALGVKEGLGALVTAESERRNAERLRAILEGRSS